MFQIAANEETFGLDRLYRISEIARRLTEPYHIGRVIDALLKATEVQELERARSQAAEQRKRYSATK